MAKREKSGNRRSAIPLQISPVSGDMARRKPILITLVGLTAAVAVLGLILSGAPWADDGQPDETPREASTPTGAARNDQADQPPDPDPTVSSEEPTSLPAEPEPPEPTTEPPAPSAEAQQLKAEELEVAQQLVELLPTDPDALAVLGKVYHRHGNSAEAVKLWQRCLQVDPKRADCYVNMGEVAFSQGDSDEAAAAWTKAIEINPAAPGVHGRLGSALLSGGKAQEAVPAFLEELKISPDAATTHFLLGDAYTQLADYEQAKASYLNAVRIQPDLWNAYYGLIRTCRKLRQVDEMKQYQEQFKTLKDKDFSVSIDRTNEFDDLQSVRRGAASTLTTVGRIYLARKLTGHAEMLWRRAAAIAPAAVAPRDLLARLFAATKREADALSIYEELMDIYADSMDREPTNPLHCVNLGATHARAGRFDEAETLFQKAQTVSPQHAAGYEALARLFLSTNRNLPQARTLAARAVELDPRAANYATLSEASDKTGDRDGALSAIRAAVEREPGNERYRRIYQQLQQRP